MRLRKCEEEEEKWCSQQEQRSSPTSQMIHGDGGGGDPRHGAEGDLKVALHVQEEEAKVLEDAGGQAHD